MKRHGAESNPPPCKAKRTSAGVQALDTSPVPVGVIDVPIGA